MKFFGRRGRDPTTLIDGTSDIGRVCLVMIDNVRLNVKSPAYAK